MIIWASIITFNPEKDRLQANLESIYSQVDNIVIVDNGSENVDVVKQLSAQFNCQLFLNKKNKGIAHALNQVCEYVCKQGDSWVLTLDQDSICQKDLIATYKHFLDIPDIGVITCDIFDRNTGIVSNGIIERHLKYKSYVEDELTFVPVAITSGCLTNVKVWTKIGGFDDKMFIDYVDFDYCLNLHKHGFKILKTNYMGLLHEIGHARKLRLLGKDCILTNHSPIRHYYIARNTVYFIKKYWNYINKFSIISEFLARVFIVPFFEKNSVRKLKAAILGMLNGLRMNVE